VLYNTQNYWVSRFCPSSGVLTGKKTSFRKLDLFPSSGEERETPTLLALIERIGPMIEAGSF
jgi:hypothetical protein